MQLGMSPVHPSSLLQDQHCCDHLLHQHSIHMSSGSVLAGLALATKRADKQEDYTDNNYIAKPIQGPCIGENEKQRHENYHYQGKTYAYLATFLSKCYSIGSPVAEFLLFFAHILVRL
eukprot:CAMPEP_0114590494 /NCGR_PEP_ID=MMETSP0125-20121206/12742_1 /TAXON_ID=485358 ORGANISM="Aristerostoma sp., Strain ATCC 50986" /NCGR_SAMPLE_ID=MMETSP0125 /ASSEMBLY_ACC=CAM_ASM_000245 /LENGTH=117 /DNA_ID=CAMNT_0001788037 /DNA_START=463 /DNA_END=816 /DNA_ORIENTATION=+